MSGAKRVLIFIDHFLPGYKAGGPVRSCANMIERLKDRYSFGVVTRDREYLEKEPFEEVQSDAWNERDAYQVYYASGGNLGPGMIRERIEEFRPDVVYINGVYSFRFSILPLYLLKGTKGRIRTIVAPRGMLAPGAMGVKALKKRLFLLTARTFGLFKNAVIHSTTEQEAEEVRYWIGEREIHTIPNLLPSIEPREDPGIEKCPGNLKLISIARIAPEKNTLGLLELLLEKGRPGVHLDLYGPVYDPEYWEKCQRLIERMPEGISVRHRSGISPEGAAEEIRKHHAFILLTKGENFGHAILEALLAGRPVLISDRTPWKGIEEKGVGKVLRLGEGERNGALLQEFLDMDSPSFDRMREQVKTYAQKLLEEHEDGKGYERLFDGGD